MATVYGSNYNKAYVLDPKQMIPAGEHNGKVRCLYDEIAFAGNVLAIADIVKLGKIPKGARILDAICKLDSLGTTGIVSLGWAASSDGLEIADPDGLILAANLDAGGQAVLGQATVGSVGLGKKFAAEVEMQAVFTEASDAALGDYLKVWIYYIAE